jgi:hypothetical protein
MAKPTKYAVPLCLIFSVLCIIGIILGLIFKSAFITIIFLLPSVIYEVYRTEGKSTKASSILLLIVCIAEMLLILFRVNWNIAEFLGISEQYIGGYLVPLGDIKVLGPTLMAVLSVILFIRTHGIYTRWLAVNIFITSFAIIYTLDPALFPELVRFAVQEGFEEV